MSREMRGWRAWHWDGSKVTVYASSEARWQRLPPEGIVGVVVYREPPYRWILDGHDWVWLQGGELRTVTTHPRWGEWAPKPRVGCGACVKRGAAVPDGRWALIQREMMAAREAP